MAYVACILTGLLAGGFIMYHVWTECELDAATERERMLRKRIRELKGKKRS